MIKVGRLSEEKEVAYSRTIDDVTAMYKKLSVLRDGATDEQIAVMNDCLEHAQLFIDSDIAVATLTAAKREEVRALWSEGEPERR